MEDEIDFKEYFFIMKKNWWVILITFLLISTGIIWYTFTATPTYEAESRVIFTGEDQTSFILGNTRTTRVDIETEVAIMQSTTVLDLVSEIIPGEYEIEITPIKDSDVISIIVSADDRMIAQGAANAIADSYVNYSVYTKRDSAIEVSDFITEQLDSYEINLDILNKMLLNINLTENSTVDEQLQYKKITQEIKAKQELYNYLLSRREEVGILSHEKGASVQVLEYAVLPILPTKPNIPMNIVLGLFLGIAAGVGISFLKENFRDRLTNISEIEKMFGPIVLGVIPKIKGVKRNIKILKSHYKSIIKGGFKVKLSKKNKYLTQYYKPQSKFSEEMRKLRTNVLFYLKDNDMKLISVTSPGNKEGKTTIACNLALSIAKNNKKVLLIDANLRNSQILKAFNTNSIESKGLAEHLLNDVTLSDVILKTKSKNLYILPAGAKQEFPSELLSSHAMKLLCTRLKSMEYDVILIDNASMDYSEAAFMGADSDGVLMVIGHDKSKRSMTDNAIVALKKTKAKIIGVVVNN